MCDGCLQVAPSFFDAPGAQAAGKVNPRPRAPHYLMGSMPSTPGASPNSTQRFSQDLPDIAFVFVSESGYKVCHSSFCNDSSHSHSTGLSQALDVIGCAVPLKACLVTLSAVLLS